MRAWSRARRKEGRSIGLVPTMGALHEGHASLMRAAVSGNRVAVASLFVNPAQFGPSEDFDKYPRSFDADCAMADGIGIKAIYAPSVRSMYPDGYATYVNVERLTAGLCGRSRPTFFRGVATVVTKLFNAVEPDRAYFGQKDAQQCAVIRRMARDLDLGIEIVEMPIVRESDGLAMSSRNTYLSPEEREQALGMSRGLFAAQRLFEQGERDVEAVRDVVRRAMKDFRIDYIEAVDANEMTPVDKIYGRVLLAAAGWVGNTRLIDNVVLQAGIDKAAGEKV
jgi:pantoate--beta-alanine ligase